MKTTRYDLVLIANADFAPDLEIDGGLYLNYQVARFTDYVWEETTREDLVQRLRDLQKLFMFDEVILYRCEGGCFSIKENKWEKVKSEKTIFHLVLDLSDDEIEDRDDRPYLDCIPQAANREYSF